MPSAQAPNTKCTGQKQCSKVNERTRQCPQLGQNSALSLYQKWPCCIHYLRGTRCMQTNLSFCITSMSPAFSQSGLAQCGPFVPTQNSTPDQQEANRDNKAVLMAFFLVTCACKIAAAIFICPTEMGTPSSCLGEISTANYTPQTSRQRMTVKGNFRAAQVSTMACFLRNEAQHFSHSVLFRFVATFTGSPVVVVQNKQHSTNYHANTHFMLAGCLHKCLNVLCQHTFRSTTHKALVCDLMTQLLVVFTLLNHGAAHNIKWLTRSYFSLILELKGRRVNGSLALRCAFGRLLPALVPHVCSAIKHNHTSTRGHIMHILCTSQHVLL